MVIGIKSWQQLRVQSMIIQTNIPKDGYILQEVMKYGRDYTE
jgi:hypothetical protein